MKYSKNRIKKKYFYICSLEKTHFMKQKLLLLVVIFAITIKAQITDVLTSGLSEPAGLAISGNYLYVAESDRISKIDISLPIPVKSDLVTGLSNPDAVLIQGNTLYISEYGVSSTSGKISKIDITSTTPILTTLATNIPGATGIAIGGDNLYIAEYKSGKITKLNLTTFAKTDFLTNLNGPTGLFVDGNILYFSQFDSNKISKADITLAVPTVINILEGLDEPAFLTVANSNLYLTDYGSGKIFDANMNAVASNLGGPYGITNKGTTVFFSQRDSNKISKFDLNLLNTSNFIKSKDVSVYPNPASDFISMSNAAKNSEILIYDLTGKLISKSVLNDDGKINIQPLKIGTYIIKINNQSVKFVKK